MAENKRTPRTYMGRKQKKGYEKQTLEALKQFGDIERKRFLEDQRRKLKSQREFTKGMKDL